MPILGICYGQQVMMQELGGLVEAAMAPCRLWRAFVTPSDEAPAAA